MWKLTRAALYACAYKDCNNIAVVVVVVVVVVIVVVVHRLSVLLFHQSLKLLLLVPFLKLSLLTVPSAHK
jgi:hypothetical protein